MQKIFSLIVFLFFIEFSVFAQLYKDHNWEEKSVFYELSTKDAALSSVAIKEKHLIQYHSNILGNNVRLYQTYHTIIRVNNEKGINEQSKVYIPMRNVIKLLDIKARVTDRNGNIKTLDIDNIKEVKNVEDYGNFKIFAIEGLTKDSQLEYIYTVEKELSSLGTVLIQKNYQVNEAEVILRGTVGYRIKHKTYNGFPELNEEVVEGDKTAYRSVGKNIPAMIDESHAAYNANRMKVTYYAKSNSLFVEDNMQWFHLENNLRYNYVTFNANKFKDLTKDFSNFTAGKDLSNNQLKINAVCDYIHQNFQILRNVTNEGEDINKDIKSKQASEYGIVKIYNILFTYLEIPYELALTSNRFNHKFDKDFFTNLNLQELLIYFPTENKYIDPIDVLTYLDFAPKENIGNEALYINKNDSRFGPISVPSMDQTKTIKHYIISWNDNNSKIFVSSSEKLTGYRASNMRGAYRYFKMNNDLSEFKKNTASSIINDLNISKFEVVDEALNNATENKPFEIKFEYSSKSIIETIGNDLMLNVGKVMGSQSELYQEVTRVNPVEIDYLNEYNHQFTIKIPQGYKPVNLSDFVINKVYKSDTDQLICQFVSNYKWEGDEVVIKITESYNQLIMPVDFYEKYRDVINAAFDFSNKSLLFQKE